MGCFRGLFWRNGFPILSPTSQLYWFWSLYVLLMDATYTAFVVPIAVGFDASDEVWNWAGYLDFIAGKQSSCHLLVCIPWKQHVHTPFVQHSAFATLPTSCCKIHVVDLHTINLLHKGKWALEVGSCKHAVPMHINLHYPIFWYTMSTSQPFCICCQSVFMSYSLNWIVVAANILQSNCLHKVGHASCTSWS